MDARARSSSSVTSFVVNPCRNFYIGTLYFTIPKESMIFDVNVAKAMSASSRIISISSSNLAVVLVALVVVVAFVVVVFLEVVFVAVVVLVPWHQAPASTVQLY